MLIEKNKQKKIRQRYGKGKERLEQSKICLHNVSAVMFYRYEAGSRQFRATSRKSDWLFQLQ
jgi:hypothetical protein